MWIRNIGNRKEFHVYRRVSSTAYLITYKSVAPNQGENPNHSKPDHFGEDLLQVS